MSANQSILQALDNLITVVAQLRSPEGGCPWDLAQTQQSLIPYVVEEAYEVVHALQSQDQKAIAEELGDFLLQVVLQAQVAQDLGHFNLEQVAQGITEKLIRRHPHVFDNLTVADEAEIRRNWEAIKAQEKGLDPQQNLPLSAKLERYNSTLPPLMAGSKIAKKAAANFEWQDGEEICAELEAELSQFQASLGTENKAHQQEKLGDLIFSLINLAQCYDLDASLALHGSNQRFIQRLKMMEDS